MEKCGTIIKKNDQSNVQDPSEPMCGSPGEHGGRKGWKDSRGVMVKD